MAKLTEERVKAITACTDVVKFVRDTQPDLEPMDVMMKVDYFWHEMGNKAMIDLAAYIKYAKEHVMPDFQIAGTVGHDLNGAGSRCFLPRSDGYSERLDEE